MTRAHDYPIDSGISCSTMLSCSSSCCLRGCLGSRSWLLFMAWGWRRRLFIEKCVGCICCGRRCLELGSQLLVPYANIGKVFACVRQLHL
mmetsp:Transcript_15871/g.40904  ORF Transcript_15871/g.40904 Transcript_15871/m.40904 type:complete len:90 (-) Transcript_15871:310-579(-)